MLLREYIKQHQGGGGIQIFKKLVFGTFTARAHIEGTSWVEKGLVGSLVFGVFLVFSAREPLGCFLGACSLWPGFHVSDRLPGGPGPERGFCSLGKSRTEC